MTRDWLAVPVLRAAAFFTDHVPPFKRVTLALAGFFDGGPCRVFACNGEKHDFGSKAEAMNFARYQVVCNPPKVVIVEIDKKTIAVFRQ